MNQAPSYEGLLAEVMLLGESGRRKSKRIACLERPLYGVKAIEWHQRRPRRISRACLMDFLTGPNDERSARIQQAAREIKAGAEKRRKASKSKTNRPVKYQYYGLEERRREILPQDLDTSLYDKIGQDETRMPHREPAKFWVEVIVRPACRLKTDRDSLSQKILEQQPDVTLPGCMAHVRRKFTDARPSHPCQAQQAIKYIQPLYELEANLKARKASPEEIAAERQAKALPIMDTMEVWMRAAAKTRTPSDLFGKALDYAYKPWPRLRRYADNGIYQIDNNPVGRNQRPSVMGRKNHLFSKTDRGAEDNAVFHSLLESCQIVGVNQLQWLTDVLQRLACGPDENHLHTLLPYNYKKSQ